MSTLFPSLALSAKEASAMSFYELSAPRSAQAGGLFSGIADTLCNTLKAFQYGQMLRAMLRLTNEQLDTIGITRSDIPDFAHKAIYND